MPKWEDDERQLIGCILTDPDCYHEVDGVVVPDDFAHPTHVVVMNAIRVLSGDNTPISPFSVAKEVHGLASSVLTDMINDVVSTAYVGSLARVVRSRSVARGLKHMFEGGISALDKGTDAIDVLLTAEKRMIELADVSTDKEPKSISSVLSDVVKRVEHSYENKELISGVPSGFIDLDTTTCGYQGSDLVIIAGRPSMGKTAIALNSAMNCNVPCALFSLEMSKEQLVYRALCGEAGIDAHRVRTGTISEKELGRLNTGAGNLAERELYIDDTPGITIQEICSSARRLKAKHDIQMVIVDYIQLITCGREKFQSREQEISAISRRLKQLARDLKIPVIALSQLNRQVETRNDKRPNMADLRESGAIEQDADLILFIYRNEVYYPEDEATKGLAEIIVGKHRNGPLGTVKLMFDAKTCSFKNLAKEVVW